MDKNKILDGINKTRNALKSSNIKISDVNPDVESVTIKYKTFYSQQSYENKEKVLYPNDTLYYEIQCPNKKGCTSQYFIITDDLEKAIHNGEYSNGYSCKGKEDFKYIDKSGYSCQGRVTFSIKVKYKNK